MKRNTPRLPLPEYLLQIARDIYAECEAPEKARARPSITLRRRFRGTSRSDLLGEFSYRSDNWLGDGPEQQMLMNMYSFQIVRPVIRANQAAMMQARVECLATPQSKKPSVAGVASIATGIYRYWNNHPDYWSHNVESQFNQQIQTDYGCFFHTHHDPLAEADIEGSLEEWADEPVEQPGQYACTHCGAGGEIFSVQMGQAADGRTPCLQCGAWAEILEMPEFPDVPQFKGTSKFSPGNTKLDIVPSAEIRIDERNTKNGRIRNAEWLEHHFLIDEDKYQALVPYCDLGTPAEWSFTLKWQYALETGTDLHLKSWTGGTGSQRLQHEARRIYLRPDKYREYRAPQDFVLDRGDGYAATNPDGTLMLAIKAGERLIDKFPHGFWFMVHQDRLLPIVKACDLRDEWSYGGFLNDAASFWHQPAAELNEMQRAANNLYTIDMQHRESASITTTIFDRNWFNAADFERGLSPTKQGVQIEPTDDIHRHFAEVRPPQMQGAMQGVEFVRSLVPDVSGMQPAAMGAPSPGEPYAAQRLQKQQSLGLLTPSQHSKAEAKVSAFRQFLKFAQDTKPLEWFHYIAGIYGEEWKDQDIQIFLDSNLALDLLVTFREGSEVPNSLIEQEIRYRQYVLDVAEVVKLTGQVELLQPEMLSKYGRLAGVDHDLDNVEADLRLASTRYFRVKSWVEENRDAPYPEAQLIDLALADRSLFPMERENHRTHIEFWVDHARALMARDEPDHVLIGCCVKMVERHEEGTKAMMQKLSEIKTEGEAPELALQLAAAKEQAAAEAALQREKLEGKDREIQGMLQRQQMIEATKLEEGEQKRLHDSREKQADRVIKAAEIEAKANDTGETPTAEEPIDPIQSIAESIDYEDLPPPAQRDMLNRVGLPASGVNEVNQATLERAQIAANKARASQAARSNGASQK